MRLRLPSNCGYASIDDFVVDLHRHFEDIPEQGMKQEIDCWDDKKKEPEENNKRKKRKLRESAYTESENIMLVGLVFEELFTNPALNKASWNRIARKFNDNLKARGVNENKKVILRTGKALDRHFKVLKERNRKNSGNLFRPTYFLWKNKGMLIFAV
eukprot:snap_masked-scaffold_11-processed-gene-5.43-mRNA-1 protein AED:1.00 eAED:1.00 QI:0/-1/0/0/-1/1/1/0/156